MSGKGTSYFTKRARERAAQFSNPFVYLRDDGEKARLRFLSDMDGFFSGVFHRPWVKGRLQSPVVCVEQDDNPPTFEGMTEKCDLCGPEENPRLQFFAPVFVYYILHPHQNPALEKDASAPKWQAVKVKGETKFKQDVQKVKVLLGGKRIWDSLLALEEESEGDGLLGRDYTFVRNGARRSSDTTYAFVPGKDSKLTKEVEEAIGKMEDIEAIALEGTAVFYSIGAKADAAEDVPAELDEEEEAEAEVEETEEATETEATEEAENDEEFANL